MGGGNVRSGPTLPSGSRGQCHPVSVRLSFYISNDLSSYIIFISLSNCFTKVPGAQSGKPHSIFLLICTFCNACEVSMVYWKWQGFGAERLGSKPGFPACFGLNLISWVSVFCSIKRRWYLPCRVAIRILYVYIKCSINVADYYFLHFWLLAFRHWLKNLGLCFL